MKQLAQKFKCKLPQGFMVIKKYTKSTPDKPTSSLLDRFLRLLVVTPVGIPAPQRVSESKQYSVNLISPPGNAVVL